MRAFTIIITPKNYYLVLTSVACAPKCEGVAQLTLPSKTRFVIQLNFQSKTLLKVQYLPNLTTSINFLITFIKSYSLGAFQQY